MSRNFTHEQIPCSKSKITDAFSWNFNQILFSILLFHRSCKTLHLTNEVVSNNIFYMLHKFLQFCNILTYTSQTILHLERLLPIIIAKKILENMHISYKTPKFENTPVHAMTHTKIIHQNGPECHKTPQEVLHDGSIQPKLIIECSQSNQKYFNKSFLVRVNRIFYFTCVQISFLAKKFPYMSSCPTTYLRIGQSKLR